jgi:DtxR family Mn-dependent transcriptional regulator
MDDMKHNSFNESAEMYLKTVSELGVGDAPVPISALADRLDISTVSATEMIHRLQGHGLLDHRPYKGVYLTEEGRRQATDIVRSHRLWERFLTDRLGLPWADVHDLACRLEHATDSRVTEALEDYLGHPDSCPHGNPIPAADGAIATPADRPLNDLCPGRAAYITRSHPETQELLVHLAELGLVTGSHLTIHEIVPFNGPLVLMTDDGLRYLGQEAARRVYVRPAIETECPSHSGSQSD